MKKKIIDNDQEINPVHDTVDLKDLQADLKTKLGDGELWEDEGKFYYKPDSDKTLYAVDFDTYDTEKWMQGAVKKPGALHESLGISKDKEIPMSLINEKIATLRKKGEGDKKLSADEKKLLERLIFAKNAKSISKKKKDLITNSEDSEDNDPRTIRTDSTDESCPLLKNKQKKSAMQMKKVEETSDMYDKKKEDETVQDEKDKEETVADTIPEKTEVEEDMKKEKKAPSISPDEIKDLVADLVQKELDLLTADFKAREEKIKKQSISDLSKTLQEEPYGYSAEDLEGQSLDDLEKMKSFVENSKLYKDFMKSKETIEERMEINKEIFNSTDDFYSMGDDPWGAYKSGTIRKGDQ